MHSTTLVIFTFSSLLQFQHLYCLSRIELQQEYNPPLLRLRDIFRLKYDESTQEFNTLVAELAKHQDRSRNVTQTQINNIRNITENAKKTPNITTAVLNCLKNQESAVGRLTVNTVTNCYSSSNTSVLINTKARFSTLNTVASNTINWCSSLNPLETQLNSLEKCLSEKVSDLYRQINIVEREYYELSNSTLQTNIKCLTDKVGVILSQIGSISYEINVCFFAGKY